MSSSVSIKWQVISVGILIKNGKILLGLRPVKHQGGKSLWEFPGGGVERNEHPQKSMIREFKEELDIQIKESEIAGCLCDHGESKSRLIVFYYITKWEGEIKKKFHQELNWFSYKDCIEKKVPNINPSLFEEIIQIIKKMIL